MSVITVAKYLRLSMEDHDLDQSGKLESNSIGNQRNLLDAYLSRMPEFTSANILEFCDDGWSGKNFERPAIQELLVQVKQGNIQCIIVKDLSRFGRDYLTVGNYISRVFPFLGVRFIAVNDGFDSIRPMDIDSLDTSFKTLLYDLYSRDLSRKVRAVKRFRAQKGYFLSPFAPFGYVKDPKDKNHLLVDPEAAEVVRRIFQMAADGWDRTGIAKELNKEAVPTPMLYKRAAGCSRTVWPSVNEENFWEPQAITRILRDERYVGKNIYGKRSRDRVGHTHSVKVSRVDWITVEHTHEGVVSRELFDRAQENLKKFVEYDASTKGNKLLRRKIVCGVCGHAMARSHGKEPYYACRTPLVTDSYPCPMERTPEADITDALLNGLRVQTETAVEISRIWEEQRREAQRDTAATKKVILSLQGAIEQQNRKIRSLYESFALGDIGKTEYLAMKSAVVKERNEAAEQIAKLAAELECADDKGKLNNRFVDSFQKYAAIEELTKEIVEDVLKEIRIYPGGRFEIVWNYQEEFEKILLALE